MNPRRIFLLTVLALATAALFGADFWQKSKFPEWSDKEVRKMLFDSPWAKPVEVHLGGGMRSGGGGGGRGKRGGGGGDIGAMVDASSDSMGSGGGRGGRGGGGGVQAPESAPTTTITIRWHTALPIKQAVARMQYGPEAATSPEAAKRLARQETRYVVGFDGLPPQIMKGDPAQLKARARMKIKGKEPVTAEDVQGGQGSVYFFFSRKPEILLADEEVEVSLKLANTDIRRKFKLKDMVFEGKLEI